MSPNVFAYRGALLPLTALPALLLPASPTLGAGRLWGGFALALLGLALRLAGVRQIGARARVHRAGARELASSGAFARVRNPLYLGNLLMLGGALWLLRSPAGAALAGLAGLGLYTLVVLHEEQALRAQLGAPYRDYLARTPRWVPSLGARRVEARASQPVPWRSVLSLEGTLVLGVLALPCLALLLQRWYPLEVQPLGARALLGALLLSLSLALFLWVRRRRRRSAPGSRGH